MSFKIGDKVKFLDEKGEGTVTRIINKHTVGVTIEDGFEIPFSITNLVKIEEEGVEKKELSDIIFFETKKVQKSITIKAVVKEEKEEEEGIYLAFSPENSNNINGSSINVWLINHTSYQIIFTYSLWNNGHYLTLETGKMKAFDVDLVQTIERKELNDHRNFKIDALFYKKESYEHLPPVSNIIKLRPIKLYKENTFKKNSFITDNALLFPVFKLEEMRSGELLNETAQQNLSKLFFQKKHPTVSSKISKPHIHNNPESEIEIDLHIEELLDDYSNMSNAEIIKVQLNYFQNALDKAITQHLKKVIVIHGVGNGRLKQEVRTIIAENSSLKCYDASYAKYGFGATEIIIT